MSEAEPQAPISHKLRWFQYRLRTLLLIMLLASVGMSVWAVRARRVKNDIADALQSTSAPIEFVETPLVDVVAYLKHAHKIDIGIDQDALQAAGMDKNLPVTFNLRGISLQSSLRLILRGPDLTYVVRDKALWITTPQQAAASGGTAITVETGTVNDYKIAKALKQPTVVEFVETPLKDVIDYLKDEHHVEILLDPKVFWGTKPLRDPDDQVTLQFKNISLQSGLRIILRELDLDYAICNEVILITTPEEARILNPARRDFKSPDMIANEKRIAAALASPPPANLKHEALQVIADELKRRHKIVVQITPAARKLESAAPFKGDPKLLGRTLGADLTAILDMYEFQYETRDESLVIMPKPKVAR
jgi:hypothetical protein